MSRDPHISFIDTDYCYGFHVLKRPTLVKTAEYIVKNLPFNAIQTYISNSRSRAPPKCDIDDVIKAGKILKKYIVKPCIHACLLYNLAGITNHKKDPKFHSALTATRQGLTAELDIGAGMCAGVVVHIGSCVDRDKGIHTISKTIEHVLTVDTDYSKKFSKKLNITQPQFKKRRKIILENSAREGHKLGGVLEDIRDIIQGVKKEFWSQIKVCIDTAHAFGAGIYDWGKVSEVKRFYSDFDKIIGLEHLEMFHLNDSMCSKYKRKNAPFGSKKDRHQNLGLGYIFGDGIGDKIKLDKSRLDGLKEFLEQARKRKLMVIGEPPSKDEHGHPGLGGRRDWGYVCNLLKNTKHPLIKTYNLYEK